MLKSPGPLTRLTWVQSTSSRKPSADTWQVGTWKTWWGSGYSTREDDVGPTARERTYSNRLPHCVKWIAAAVGGADRIASIKGKSGGCDGGLMRGGVQGGGGEPRRHLGGRWYGGRWHDDVDVVGDSGPKHEGDPHCSIAVVAVHPCRVTLPLAGGVLEEWEPKRIREDPHHSPKSPTYHLCKPMVQRS